MDIVTLNEQNLKQWQDENLEHLRYEYDLKPGEKCIDIGSYHREWASKMIQKYGVNVECFDALDNKAAWIFNGQMSFGGQFYYTSIFGKNNPVTYHCVDIADYLQEEIAVCKINIEGGEYQLLDYIGKTGNAMIDFVEKYGDNVYSQNGEDFIIQECLKRMKLPIGTCVEFGGADGYFCSNIRLLMDSGWKGLQFDIHQSPEVIHQMITPENVTQILGHHVDILSIDIDGNDYNVWKAYKGTPKIVIIEINSSIEPTRDSPVSDSHLGTAYKPMVELGQEKGYFLLCHTGNLIFIEKKYKKLFPEINLNPITNHEEYFNTQWLH